MQNLKELTEKIAQNYGQLSSITILPQKISLSDSGSLRAGKAEYHLTPAANQQFARKIHVDESFYRRTFPDVRAFIFNRHFGEVVEKQRISEIRLVINGGRVIGHDNPTFWKLF